MPEEVQYSRKSPFTTLVLGAPWADYLSRSIPTR